MTKPFKFIKSVYDLVRFEHAAMVVVGIYIGQQLTGIQVPLETLALFWISPFLIELSSFALNDYFDLESDRKNKKTDRPLVRGDLTPRFALNFSIIGYIIAGAYSYTLGNMACFAIVLAILFGSIAYNRWLKRTPLYGNLFIAISMLASFIYGNLSVSTILTYPNILLSLLAFSIGLGREIAKTIQDVEGDKLLGAKTLPMVIGEKHSAILASTLLIIGSLSAFALPVLDKTFFSLAYLPTGLAGAMIIYSAYLTFKLEKLKTVRKITLISLGIAMISITATVAIS